MSNNKSSQIVSTNYNSPEERMKAPVSIVKGCKSAIVERITVGTLLERINRGENEFTQKMRKLKLSNDAIYQVTKKWDCYGFIPGLWEKREDSKNKTYIPLLGLDIDYISLNADGSLSGEAVRIFNMLATNEYIFAAYPSLGGGLRFLVWAECNNIDWHKEIYSKVVAHFCAFLNIPVANSDNKTVGIDAGCNNASRHWLYSPQSMFYMNPSSTPFPFTPTVHTNIKTYPVAPLVINAQPVNSGLFNQSSIELELMQLIDNALSDNYAGRNARLFGLNMRFKNNNISIDSALSYCQRFEESDFKLAEIIKTIESAYKIAKTQYTVNQALFKFKKGQ